MNIDATHLVSLFENATEGIVLTNGKGQIVLVNPAAQRMFGYKENELIGSPIEVLLPERVKPHHHHLREGFYEHPQNRVMGHGRDLYGKTKEGNEIPVEVSLSFYKRDNELFVIAFIVDITHRKMIEANMLHQQKELERVTNDMRKLNTQLEAKVEERTMILKEALQKLEESQLELSAALDKERQLNEIKSRFVSMASHEFRTPLSTILSSATLIGKYPTTEQNERREKHIRKIKDSVTHLNGLLEDFLSLGKLEEGKVTVHVSTFPVKDFMEDTLEEMKVVQKENQQIHLDYQGDGNFTTDKRLLKNILINLVSNALKYSDEGSNVWINVENKATQVSVTIKDEGVGIPADDQSHLFTTFFRGKNVTNIEGTGLGLPIVKKYLDLLEGKIDLKSELNVGTTVKISLPSLKENKN
jgi:PAS domain S-box-containing protein